MSTECLISIIIPCYNSAAFLSRTLDELLKQDLSACEVIAVNDGSSDATLSILQGYQGLFPSSSPLRVINQSNQGVSRARNVGIAAARGDFVSFLDSDDRLMPSALKHYKDCIASNPSCDYWSFGYEMVTNQSNFKLYVFPSFERCLMDGLEYLRLFLNKLYCTHICSCLVSKKMLIENNLFFSPGIRIGEDVLFIMQVLSCSRKACYSKRLCFQYLVRDNSTMQGYKSYSVDQYNSFRLWRDYLYCLKRNYPELSDSISFFVSFTFLSNLYYYLRASVCINSINIQFLEDSDCRKQPLSFINKPLWIVLKVFQWIPIRLLFRIFKRC